MNTHKRGGAPEDRAAPEGARKPLAEVRARPDGKEATGADEEALAQRERALAEREFLLAARERLAAEGLPGELLQALNTSSPAAFDEALAVLGRWLPERQGAAGEAAGGAGGGFTGGFRIGVDGSGHSPAARDPIREAMGLE